ncbi:hypothetical protein DOV67_25415 [Salmonella enterica subsp. enterica serovar Java]|uniref:Acyltransferase domain-containing protein n=3 Tax=Salmonella enterica TaxID=28901 RepID=A0A403K2L9_SALER|nr:hypothetical protein [Salmonella enterica subsp. enterica serovar Java]EAO1480257.1 acyltransferase domain-containing protein [Salmonella enterica]EBR8574828.1 hypothetical protein [Salmonella enterica subsp. enterica serovar Java]ECS8432149.1 acyltransferase domain-containing protein [Salmonella enterica]EDR2522191.1 acyltransferase domain-containing protein [Salmonella enterica subsp. enterica serovar Java]
MSDGAQLEERYELDIAIIGMDGRYPGAVDLGAFWRNLCEETDVQEMFAPDNLEELVDDLIWRDASFVHAGYPLANAEEFDAAFFDITPKEAAATDPQQRLFLECCWQAMENAGYVPGEGNTRVGVFASANFNAYWAKRAADLRLTIPARYMETVIGNDKDYMATRVAWKLGLTGPALAVQSACSSSLAGISLAAQSLQLHQCDMALAGAAALRTPQRAGYLALDEGGMARDARCHSFGAGASGMIDGHGVGVVLLKRLGDALRDNDNILAVIRGSAINNDGRRKVSFSAPSVDGQRDVIVEALENAELTADDIDYVEAHGTGTPLGDPIEVAALNQVWQGSRKDRCWLGSVKSNIGHLDAASGVTAVIKTTLALMNEQLPASLNGEPPNPAIDFAQGPFQVNTQLRPWPRGDRPRRAGISSFGLGGTNAHLILQEAPLRPAADVSEGEQLIILSARSENALRVRRRQLADYMRRHPQIPLADVAFTLQIGRKDFDWRCARVCRNREEVIDWLDTDDDIAEPQKPVGVSFILPGVGQQHAGMGAELYRREAAYRVAVDRCCERLNVLLGRDLRDYLYPADPRQREMAESMALTMSALFVTEYAMTQLWQAYGVTPDAMIGHSLGQYLAAHLAGVFTLDAVLELVVRRADLIETTPAGAMLVVHADEARVRALLPTAISLGAINAPSLCMVSGLADDIEAFSRRLRDERIVAMPLAAARAGHSHLLEDILPSFHRVLNNFTLSPPVRPLMCNLSGDWLSEQEAIDPEYWVRHLRETVQFARGMERLAADAGNNIIIDMGPGGGLSTLLRHQRVRFEPDQQIISFGSAQADAHTHWLQALANVWLTGQGIDWTPVLQDARGRRVALPGYPFERQRYVLETEESVAPEREMPSVQQGVRAWLPGWARALPPVPPANNADATVWLCAEPDSLSELIRTRLEQSGRRVIALSIGQHEGWRQVDALDGECWRQLWRTLPTPTHILQLWPLDERLPARFGYDALLAFSQGAQDMGERTQSLRLTLASAGVCNIAGNESSRVAHASLLGAATVLPREIPGIRCQVADVSRDDSSQQKADNLLASLFGADWPPDGVCAWRGRQYWLREMMLLPWPEAEQGRLALRDNGRYLVLGGTGGIGHTLALGIARHCTAPYLVLVGRQALCGEREQLCTALADAGATVSYLALDLSDAATVTDTLGELIRQEGRFHGVIHAAGSVSGGLMQLGDRHAQESNLCCKADAMLTLEPVLQQSPPDFVLLCSSLSSFSPSPGQADNTAANFVLDSYALSGRLPCAVLAVNWDYWLDVGMIQALAEQHQALTGSAITEGMCAAEAVEILPSLLALLPLGQVAVSGRDLAALLHARERDDIRHFERRAVANRAHRRPALRERFVEPESDLQWVLAKLWGEGLGIDRIGIHDDYCELGGDSLMAIALTARIRETLRINFTIRTLFDYPTVAALAEYLRCQYDECEQIAALIREVSSMDERQLAERLAFLDGDQPC